MANPAWYLDESVYAGPEHLDANYVAGYDSKAQTDWSAELKKLRELGLNETGTFVDLGAGTGGLAVAAAPFCHRVVAVDVSPAMLAVIHEGARRAHLGNLEAVQAGLLSYEHQGGPADIVYTRHALHHLPDFWKVIALQRIGAILKPGGILWLRDLFFSFEPAETSTYIEQWLAGAAADSAAGWTRPELEEHLRQEYSTYTWLFEPMLARTGFTIKESDTSARLYASYVCVKA